MCPPPNYRASAASVTWYAYVVVMCLKLWKCSENTANNIFSNFLKSRNRLNLFATGLR